MDNVEQSSSPGTPPLNGTCKQHLLGIISDEGNEVVYYPSKMPIRTPADDRSGHSQKE